MAVVKEEKARNEGVLPEAAHSGSTEQTSAISRRTFMARSALVTAAAAIAPSLASQKAKAGLLPANVIADTMSGIVAFVVPGTANDPFSAAQDQVSATPGGVEGNAPMALEFGFNAAGLAPPPFDGLAEFIAFALNNIAGAVFPASANGPFTSTFANLKYAEKMQIFRGMESGWFGASPEENAQMAVLANNIIVYAGLMSYNEAGVFNPFTGELVTTPVGWIISNYGGVSDGHKDLKGYYGGVRAVSDW